MHTGFGLERAAEIRKGRERSANRRIGGHWGSSYGCLAFFLRIKFSRPPWPRRCGDRRSRPLCSAVFLDKDIYMYTFVTMSEFKPICVVGTPILENRTLEPRHAERGYLPHEIAPLLVQHVILHLSDAMPAKVLERMRREIEWMPEVERKRKLAEKIENWSDTGYGCCALKQSEIASLVRESVLYFSESRYRLFAWVIMPNHLHVLFACFSEWPLDRVVNTWKKRTGTEILKNNPALPRPFWQREYWDRYTRNVRHFYKTVDYIHQNPVKAGLVEKATDWPWSTAKVWADAGCGK